MFNAKGAKGAKEKPGKGCPLITRMNTNEYFAVNLILHHKIKLTASVSVLLVLPLCGMPFVDKIVFVLFRVLLTLRLVPRLRDASVVKNVLLSCNFVFFVVRRFPLCPVVGYCPDCPKCKECDWWLVNGNRIRAKCYVLRVTCYVLRVTCYVVVSSVRDGIGRLSRWCLKIL